MARVLFALVLTFAFLLSSSVARYAYATLLLDDAFIAGVRTLGLSLALTGTTHDRVLLTAPGLSSDTLSLLTSEGWKIRPISLVVNPHFGTRAHIPTRFRFVFSKIHMFSLVEYERIVYLDGDVTVEQNIDELFACGKFCAVLRNSNFNTGVMVITPNASMYGELVSAHNRLSSYNGGEQGFMNSYLTHFAYCPLYDPKGVSNSSHDCARLPGVYNGDIGLYFTNGNHWTTTDPKVIHYTLGDMKPWSWGAFIFMPDVAWIWLDKYSKLTPTSAEKRQIVYAFIALTVPLIAYLVVASLASKLAKAVAFVLPYYRFAASCTLGKASIFVVLIALDMLAIDLAWRCLSPLFIHPFFGWTLLLEWIFTLLTGLQLAHGLICVIHAEQRIATEIIPDILAYQVLQIGALVGPVYVILLGYFSHYAERAALLFVCFLAFASLRVGAHVALSYPLMPFRKPSARM